MAETATTTYTYQATRSIESWLARANLSLDLLQKLPTHVQAKLGRQWEQYFKEVQKFQKDSGIVDGAIECYAFPSKNASPDLKEVDISMYLKKYTTD